MIKTIGSEALPASVRVPDVGTPVHLLVAGESRPSRVVAAGDGTVTTTAPADGPALEVGADLDVFWAVPGSRVVLPCRLTGVSDQTPHRWTLTPTAASRLDRRRSPRGGAVAAVELHVFKLGATATGTLVDISEGGLRCWIDDESLALAPGDPVGVSIWLGTREARLTTVVHAVRELPRSYSGQHLVLTFETEDVTAALIQQYVVAWEIGQRRRRP